ncbi:MAG: AAA family ATPase [Acidobacteria bacterium]|nr:AAA family ATPase [Acidobacteriota bacterium]
MEGKKLIHSIRLRNFLSYGGQGEEIKLEPLNVLIGRNASGKSNLIEAINLLHAAPVNLASPIQQGGGISEWIWKGRQENSTTPAFLEAIIDYPEGINPLLYHIEIAANGQRLQVANESIANSLPRKLSEMEIFYGTAGGQGILRIRQATKQKAGSSKGRKEISFTREEQENSILSLRKDPIAFPEITYLGNIFTQFRIYRTFNLRNGSTGRFPQRADLPDDFLLEDASNLGLILSDLQYKGIEGTLIEKLKLFHPAIEALNLKVQGNTIQLFIREENFTPPTPASRLSEGTLRYLCLLTILCHPEPPPLICIEEPELGLHPDILKLLDMDKVCGAAPYCERLFKTLEEKITS